MWQTEKGLSLNAIIILIILRNHSSQLQCKFLYLIFNWNAIVRLSRRKPNVLMRLFFRTSEKPLYRFGDQKIYLIQRIILNRRHFWHRWSKPVFYRLLDFYLFFNLIKKWSAIPLNAIPNSRPQAVVYTEILEVFF